MAASWIGVMFGAAIYISQDGKDNSLIRIGSIFDKNFYDHPPESQGDSNVTASLSKLPGGNEHIVASNQTDLHSLIKSKLSTG